MDLSDQKCVWQPKFSYALRAPIAEPYPPLMRYEVLNGGILLMYEQWYAV